jgi:outer membrane protein insertion porin family
MRFEDKLLKRLVKFILNQPCHWSLFQHIISFLIATCVVVPQLQAQTAKNTSTLISKIHVQGNRKIEKDAILARLKSKENGIYDESVLRDDLQALFKTGFFFDVVIDKKTLPGKVELTYSVVEKPSIGEIVFEGNEEIKTEELQENLGVKQYEILNMTKLRDGIEKLQKMYEDKGYFLAKIDYQVEDLKKDESVRIKFNINENDKVKVRKMTFLGNKKLKDGYLKGRIKTSESGFFSFMSGSGGYKQEDFDRDWQILRFLYFNEGYVQVKIDRPQVYVTPDKKSIYITIRIDEGEQFDVGDVDFSGDLLYGRSELSDAIQINKNKIFSYEVLQKDLGELQAKYGDLGYAFANIIPRTNINEKERKVDVTFEFDKGNKVYFGQINVVGNSKTRDKVLRRELKIREGELYNETRRRESLENIQRLGFFDEVNFKTSTPPEQPDILNIDIAVKERNTGSIQLGAGYGSFSGFTLQGQVNQANFLGKGQRLGAGLNISRDGSYYNFNFTEPYFLDTDWSLGFDLYQSISNRYDYDERKLGAAFRLGHPLGENISASVRLKNEKTDLDPIYSNGILQTDTTIFPLSTATGITTSVTGILEFDNRNDRFSPSKGTYASASLEYAGFGTIRYNKANTTYRYFKKVFWEVVWRNNLSYSFISSHDNKEEPPFNELYLLGGPYSLRGYRYFRIGKSALSQTLKDRYMSPQFGYPADVAERLATRPFGGKTQIIYQTEFEFPLIAEAGIKGVTFYDIGMADDVVTKDNFYSDVGFGFRWFSPIGPLRFEWGFPLKKTEISPDPVVFDFSIGSPF